jgi:hypothetical protein
VMLYCYNSSWVLAIQTSWFEFALLLPEMWLKLRM